MTKSITMAIAVAFGLTVAANPTHAGSADVDPGDIAKIAHKLKLSKKQRRQIRNLHDAVRKTNIKLRAEMEATGIDLRRELDQDTPNETKVGVYISKISQLEGKARKARVVSWIRIRKLLSADQRKMLTLFNAGRSEYKRAKRSTRRQLRRELAAMKRELSRAARAHRDIARGERKRALKELKKFRKHKKKYKMELKPSPYDGRVLNPFGNKPKYGTLTIVAKPYAKIYVDGKLMGTTPLRMKLRPGKHSIKSVSQKGVKHKRVKVRAGDSIRMVIGH